MSLQTAQILVALIASGVLVLQLTAKLFPAVLVLASGLEALLAFHVIQLSVKGLNLWLVLGATMAVVAVVVWAKNVGKLAVTCATAVALVGAMQVYAAIA